MRKYEWHLDFIPPGFEFPPVIDSDEGTYVKLTKKQYLEIKDFISPAAAKKMSPTRYYMYYLIARFGRNISQQTDS